MPKLLVALWLCGVAAGQALPGTDHLTDSTPRSASNTAKASHAPRFPWHYMRRLGEMEVNLAVRLSSIGIRDTGPDGKAEGGRVQQAAAKTHPGTAVERVAAK